MKFVDTHCHIHSTDYPLDQAQVLIRANEAGVTKMICVGTDEKDSAVAVKFVADKQDCWASIGLHPHDAVSGIIGINKLKELLPPISHFPAPNPKIVAIGECGLDYFYNRSPRQQQIEILKAQIELAVEHNLPLIFHVREAFDDFWPIFDSYLGVRGVLHSFTDNQSNLDHALQAGLYVGVNGISTFTKNTDQQSMYLAIPVDKMLLETDAPYLTPVPKRGTLNEPAFVTLVAQFHADLRHISLEELSVATSQNATKLFQLN